MLLPPFTGDVQSGIILNMPLHATPCHLATSATPCHSMPVEVASSGAGWRGMACSGDWRRVASSGVKWHGVAWNGIA